jgi:hypothetical protein
MKHRRPITDVQSPPETCQVCDITYEIATILCVIFKFRRVALIYVRLGYVRLGLVSSDYVNFCYETLRLEISWYPLLSFV